MYEVNDDLKLFRQAFIEAMKENTRLILAEYPEKPVYSKKHKRAMKQILAGQGKQVIRTSSRSSVRTRLIAALVAAVLLLLGGFTIYAKREAVIEIMEQIYEKFTRIFYHEEQEDGTNFPDIIEEERIPTYVPNGFVLQDYQLSLSGVYVVWQKEEESITFSQGTMETVYDLDNEYSDFTTIAIGNSTVYAKQNEYLNTYIWNDGVYSYSLKCPVTLEFEDVSHMIQSVSKIEIE